MSDEIEIEEDKEEEAYIEYDITTYPSDYTIEGLYEKNKSGEIIIPFYQRKYVWSIEQASLLVESFLLGLPVPPLFLYITEENKAEIIDGQQRLQSLIYFLDGFFGVADTKDRRQVFKLTGLSEKSPFRGKSYSLLEDKFQRKLRNSPLRAINVRQLQPKHNNTSVFHIFERLNTGGTALKPQEIRNAVFRGPIVDALRLLNDDASWRSILGTRSEDKFQRDVELVLRIFSLFRKWSAYEKPMKEYLNREMNVNRKFDSLDAKDFCVRFSSVCEQIVASLGPKPFRPKGVINAAVLEAVMVILLENEGVGEGELRVRYDALLADTEFDAAIRGATTDTKIVKDRLEIAQRILCAQ
jgi:hypothetical protein